MRCQATEILNQLQELGRTTRDPGLLGALLVSALSEKLTQASWTGIYWLRGGELVLGPYVGPETEHERIPVGSGVCGTAVALNQDQVVEDVREVEAYLTCSASVRSEIVVLIRANGEIIGEIDMDSDTVGAFDSDDHCVLRTVADSLGGLLARPEGVRDVAEPADHEAVAAAAPAGADSATDSRADAHVEG